MTVLLHMSHWSHPEVHSIQEKFLVNHSLQVVYDLEDKHFSLPLAFEV